MGSASDGLALRAPESALRAAEAALRVAESALRVAELALAAEPLLRVPAAAGAERPQQRPASCHALPRGRRRFLGWTVLLHELRRERATQRAAGALPSSAPASSALVHSLRQLQQRCVDPAWASAALAPAPRSAAGQGVG